MAPMFNYLWQSALVLTVLYIPFQLLLRKEHFFALNRAILLGILLLSLALPLSRHTMPLFVDNWLHPEVEMEAVPVIPLGEYQDWDGDIIIEDGDIEEPSSIEIHWTDLLIAFWLIGTTIFLAWHTRGLWRLYKVLHDKDDIRERLADGDTLLLTSGALPSFSWMHSIVISAKDFEENGETILLHECAHIAHHHSFDRLLLLVVQAIQWWNPFVWLMADALSQVHEYQADLAVLNQGINATQYQLLLIRKAAGPAGLALVNGFKRNKLKLRIVMMNNMIKLRGAKSRYLALLPMMLLAVAFTARAEEKISDDQNAAAETPSIHYYGTMTAWDEDEVLDDCEQEPEYPGGIKELAAFIGENLRYPKESAEQGIEGRVVLSFVVEKDGSISHVEEKSSPDSLLTAEAIRVVSAMPKWTPGMQDGNLVRVRYVLPVTFRLKDEDRGTSKPKETAQSNPVSNGLYSADMLYIYDGNVVEFEDIKDLTLAGIGNVIDSVLLKSREIGEEYQKKNPKAKKSVIIMKDSLWEVDGVQMTREEMEENYPKIPTEFQQLRKEAEPLTKKNGVNIIITDQE